MKTFKLKRVCFLMVSIVILAGNLIGINALASDADYGIITKGPDNAPAGVLIGYLPRVDKVKTGEHLETFGGWVGAQFSHLVVDYQYVLCCKRTMRSMDGCKDLPVCMD